MFTSLHALAKQATLMITIAAEGDDLVRVEFFRHGRLTWHGAFVNLRTGSMRPLNVREPAPQPAAAPAHEAVANPAGAVAVLA